MAIQQSKYKKMVFNNLTLSEIITEKVKTKDIPGFQLSKTMDLKEVPNVIHMNLYNFITSNLFTVFEKYKEEVFKDIVTNTDFYRLTSSVTRTHKKIRVRVREKLVFDDIHWFKEKFIDSLRDTKAAHKDINIGDNYLCMIYDDGLQMRLLTDSTDIPLGYDPDFVRPCTYIDLASLIVLKMVGEYLCFYYNLPLVSTVDLNEAWVNIQPTRKMRKVIVLGKDWEQDYVLDNYPVKDTKVFHYIRLFNVKGEHDEA